MLSSVSSRGGSRSRRTSSSALRRSRSSAWPTGPARRPRSACGAGSHRPSSSGRATASSSTSRRPTCGRKGRASTCRSRWRCSRRPARSRSGASPVTPPSASSRSTAGCGRARARWSRPKARGGTARAVSSAPPSRGRRWPSPGSSRSRSAISRRPWRTSAATGIRRLRPRHRRPTDRPSPPDLADVRGQERARRVLEIAAAGGHNLLLAGPPGIGKTMLARRLPGILPTLDDEAALEVTRIHSVAGVLDAGAGLIRTPPFRAPHHTASAAAIVGGGSNPRPGEATLAHRGVLLLDELPEFARNVLEALRQPLEDGVIAIARVGGRCTFPARFQLVGTMNLCPCGGRGDAAAGCSCSPQPLDRYRDRLSRALLDRFDLVVALPRPRAAELAGAPSEGSPAVRDRVADRANGARHALEDVAGGRAAARPRRRAAAALRAGPREGRAGVADDRGARRRADHRGRARRRGALVSLAVGARTMSELALAMFAASRDMHATDRESRTARFAAFVASFDDALELRRLAEGGFRWIGRSDAAFPARLRAIHDPPPGLFLRGAAGRGAARSPGRRGRRCARLQRLRGARRAVALARARGRRRRRGLRARPRRRRLGPPRLPRGGRRDGRRARLRDRSRLSARARVARARDRRARPARLRVPARRRAGPVAVPGPQPDRRRPRARDRRRRGARAERRADHRRPRARGGPRGARRSRARSHRRCRRARTRCSASARRP